MTPTTYGGAVRSWAAHLADGGATSWPEWIGADRAPVEGDGPLPGAPQLEVVRRLAARRVPGLAGPSGLAATVLATAGPGRGLLDVPLPWPAEPARRFGTPPLDPAEVPDDELVRVCVGVIAGLLLALPVAEPDPPPRPRFALRRRRFTVQGAPGAAAVVRDALLAEGLVEGGSKGVHLVLVEPFETMMAEQWAVRVRGGSGITWERVWEHASVNDRIPPALDVSAIAQRLGRALGPGSVQVVVAADHADALSKVSAALGVRLRGVPPGDEHEPSHQPSHQPSHEPAATDLLRRLNLVPGIAHRTDLRPALRGLTRTRSRGPLGAPAAQLAWARKAAADLTAELEVGHRFALYAVSGDPGIVVPGADVGVRRTVDPTDTLDVALDACARAWQLTTAKEVAG